MLPSVNGDTGLWFVPTGEVLPSKRWSFSLYRSNYDKQEGLTDISHVALTTAVGLGGHVELFGSWGIVRVRRNVRNPTFVANDPEFGGVAQEVPYVRRGWSKNLGGPFEIGAKWALVSQAQGDSFSFAPRILVQIPGKNDWASTNAVRTDLGIVLSREFNQAFELTGTTSFVLRADPDQFDVSNGLGWGFGASFPSRSPFRAIVEVSGEAVFNKNIEVKPPLFVAEDLSIAPTVSQLRDPNYVRGGLVYQARPGFFVHAGFNYNPGLGDQTVGGRLITHSPWGFEARLGWYPGPRKMPPPPPPVVAAPAPAPAPEPAPAPAPAPNRNPTFSVNATCTPGTIEPGQTSNCTATATDPDGDPVRYVWSAPQGTFSTTAAQNTVWTAPNQVGNVLITVTAQDSRGGSATSTATVQVVRRQTLVFEDVHFDFDKYNLRPDALKILDDATAKLMMNGDVRITIEGHCDSIGTVEYNLALGERRASTVRDYLVNRGIMTQRLRTVSYGEERPIADNNTAAGRAQNRRAALVVILEQQ